DEPHDKVQVLLRLVEGGGAVHSEAREQLHDVREDEPSCDAPAEKQRYGGEEEPEDVLLLLAGETRDDEREDLVQPDGAGDEDAEVDGELHPHVEVGGDGRVDEQGIPSVDDLDLFDGNLQSVPHGYGDEPATDRTEDDPERGEEQSLAQLDEVLPERHLP